MTSITKEQCNSSNDNEENTSDDCLLLMADDMEEKAPLLNMMNDDLVENEFSLSTDIPLVSRTSISHCHVPDDKFDYGARNRLIAVLILCIVFMIIEIIGGVVSNSTAVVTDAAHMCIDAGSFLISLASIYLARRKPTLKLSFGYIRAEVLGALISVLTIWVATGILVYMAILRCIDRSFEVKPLHMIIVASCGVVFNIVMFFVLHANVCSHSILHHGHSHSHGHEESVPIEIVTVDQSRETKKSSKNINVQAALIHVIGDFVQSVGVLSAAILIKLKPEYKLADPICTFVFSVLVLITTITIMRDIIRILMEGVPSNINYTHVIDDLLQLPSVRHAHSLHIWSLSMHKTALSVHIAIDRSRDSMEVLNEAQEILRNKHSITHATIQVELYNEEIMNSCANCRRPNS